jgi:hypothetical protein
VQKAITDALIAAQKTHRDDTFADMLAAQTLTDAKSFNVKVDGEVVATATITEPKDKRIVSGRSDHAEAFLDWVQENYPTEVETIVQVRENWLKSFLETLEVNLPEPTEDNPEPDPELFDPNTGEAVPGTKLIPAAEPTTWSLRFKKGEESKAQILASSLPPDALVMLGITPAPSAIETGDAE